MAVLQTGSKRAAKLMQEQCDKIKAQIKLTDEDVKFCNRFSVQA